MPRKTVYAAIKAGPDYQDHLARSRGYNKKRYQTDPEFRESVKERARLWRLNNPEKVKQTSASWRARLDGEHAAKWRRKHYYGLAPEEFDRMLNLQNGSCAICKKSFGEAPFGRRLAVDHCHDTGKVRGLLCSQCNGAIGLLGESPKRIRAAADYVARSGTGRDQFPLFKVVS